MVWQLPLGPCPDEPLALLGVTSNGVVVGIMLVVLELWLELLVELQAVSSKSTATVIPYKINRLITIFFPFLYTCFAVNEVIVSVPP